MESPTATSLISQSISRNLPDSVSTVSSPGEKGAYLVRLDIYNCLNIANLTYRRTNGEEECGPSDEFLTSVVDPLHMQVQQVVREATQQIKRIKDLKKDIWKKNSFSSFNNIRHQTY